MLYADQDSYQLTCHYFYQEKHDTEGKGTQSDEQDALDGVGGAAAIGDFGRLGCHYFCEQFFCYI